MSSSHRHGILPPHLLKHLAQSHDPRRAARARVTLLADERARFHRAAATDRRNHSRHKDDTTTDSDPGLERVIHDAQNKTSLPGEEVRREHSEPTGDDSVNRAYEGLGHVYRLFRDVYDRESLDGRGMPLLGVVHYGTEYANAFWDGQLMAFGDGDGDVFQDFTLALDVLGHELAHGVIEHTTGLVYMDQPGALNEHVADVFGALVKQYVADETAEEADWLIGDGLFTDAVQGAALRSMKAPGTAYDDDVLGKDPQPAHMDQYVTTFEDNGGVHINSGIPNRAFQLAATEIGGKAWEGAGRIWYEALTYGDVKPRTDFAAFATVTREAAVRLHGDGSAEAAAVAGAWERVGVAS